MSTMHDAPGGALRNQTSVYHLLTLLASALDRPSPHLHSHVQSSLDFRRSPPSRRPSRVSRAFDLLLNPVLPYRYLSDDDEVEDSAPSPPPSSPHSSTEERAEAEAEAEKPASVSSGPPRVRAVRLRDEWTSLLFLLRSHGHFDRANALQLLADRLREQRRLALPSSLLSPPSSAASPPSASVQLPFTSASAVLALLLELAGSAPLWNEVPPPLLRQLQQRVYADEKLSAASAVVLPIDDASLASAALPSPLLSSLRAYGVDWASEKAETSVDEEFSPYPLAKDAWLVDCRLSAPIEAVKPGLWRLQPALSQPALFSFQKAEAAQPYAAGEDEWLSLLSSPAASSPAVPASFVALALSNAAADGLGHRAYGEKEGRQKRDADQQAARFTKAWQSHRESLLRSASAAAPPNTVWQQAGAHVPLPLSPVDPLLVDFPWPGGKNGSLPFSPSSLSLFSHPQLFERLYASTLSSVFKPASILTPDHHLLLPGQVEDVVVRCSLLALQAFPSALYSLSASSADLVVAESSAVRYPSSAARILQGCALTGSLLHRIERLTDVLLSQGPTAQGLASSLARSCGHFRQQIARLPAVALQRRQSTAASLPLTLLELQCHAESLQRHLSWLYDLLLRPFASSAAASAVEAPPLLPTGVELLSFLYHHCLALPTDSPFFPTATALFHSALAPYLDLLHSLVYRGRVFDPHRELVADPSALQAEGVEARLRLRLPTFLSGEEARLERVGKSLRLLDRTARAWSASCEDFDVPVLRVGYSIRDVERLRGWREELRTQQQSRLQELERAEEAKLCAAQEALTTKRRTAVVAARARSEDAAEEEEEQLREKRSRQAEYQRQLDAQMQEKAQRLEEERDRERVKREQAAQKRRDEQRIVEEEKARLVALIKATQEGLDEQLRLRADWRTRRMERSEPLAAVLRSEQAAWDETMRQREAKSLLSSPSPDDVDTGSEADDDAAPSDADYHTDDEGESPRSRSRTEEEAERATSAPRPLLLAASRARPFAFSYESPASPRSSAPSPHLLSPSPRHVSTDTDDSELHTSAFHIPSPLAGPPSLEAKESKDGVEGSGAGAGRKFVFDAVPSPKSGLDSGASSSPATSPRHGRHSSTDSAGSSVATSATERSTPGTRSTSASALPSPSSQLLRRTVVPALPPSTEKAEAEMKVAGAAEYNWEEPLDWAEAVTAQEAEEERAATQYGDDGNDGWTEDEEEERPQAEARADSDDDSSPAPSAPLAPSERLQRLHAETQRSRLLNRELNTASAVTFASAGEAVEEGAGSAQSELIRLMAAKEAQRASNEGRGAARERNVTSRVFEDDREGDGRRDEGAQLRANRQRMMASAVFPEPPPETKKEPRLPSQPSTDSQPPTDPQRLPSLPAPEDAGEAVAVSAVSPEVKVAVVEPPPPPSPQEQPPPPVDEAVMSQPLSVDVAVRSSLLSALHAQCALVDRVTLSFFVHSLRVGSHLQSLQRFFLMRAGDLLDTFTASLFAAIQQQPALPLTPPAILHHWQTAVELCPPPPSLFLHPALISFSVSSATPAPSLKLLAGMEAIDSVRMRYDVQHPLSVLLTEDVVASYGSVFSLLLRVLWTRHEMRELFLWLRVQDAEMRKRETLLHSLVRRSAPRAADFSAKLHRPQPSAAADDLGLLSPTKQRQPARGSSPFSAARDDDVFQAQRAAVAAARAQLEGLVQARWRLRWVHAVRAEMEHALGTVHHYLHIACIATQSSAFDAQWQSAQLTSLYDLLALHSAYLAQLIASTFLSSPSPVASLLEAVLSTVVTFAQSLSSCSLLAAVDAERWQGLKEVGLQFRRDGVFLSRVLKAAREEGRGEEGVAAFEASFDFNRFYATLRQRELEATLLPR